MSVVIEQRREHVISCEVGLIIFLLLNYLIYNVKKRKVMPLNDLYNSLNSGKT